MKQTTQQGLGRRLTDRMMDLDSPTYGDEREKAVVTEASSFALTLTIFVNIAVAVVAAVLGAIALPVVLVVLTAVPAFAMSWYAKQRAVDIEELASRVSPLSRAGTLVGIFAGLLLVVAAIGWTVFTGDGLVTVPLPDAIGPDASGAVAGFARGGVIGGVAGVFIGLVALLVGMRRKKRKAAEGSADDLD